jgi:hypothetical protein
MSARQSRPVGGVGGSGKLLGDRGNTGTPASSGIALIVPPALAILRQTAYFQYAAWSTRCQMECFRGVGTREASAGDTPRRDPRRVGPCQPRPWKAFSKLRIRSSFMDRAYGTAATAQTGYRPKQKTKNEKGKWNAKISLQTEASGGNLHSHPAVGRGPFV